VGCCQVEVSATGWWQSYRIWCAVVCDLSTSRFRRPWPALGHSATGKIDVILLINMEHQAYFLGHSWLRHCTTSRKFTGSIPDGVTGIYHWHNPFSRTVVLGLTQPLTEMSASNNSLGVKTAGAYGWQTYHLHVAIVLKTGNLIVLEPYGPLQACNGIAALHECHWLI
jgi:hypothetical protein